MKTQHLSDEAVAAYADGVLGGIARERANRHVRECAECRSAVRVQREAASVLRHAPAPPLPSSLADRLRSVPMTTPITTLPTAIGPDGSTMLATFGSAAFVPNTTRRRRASRPPSVSHRPPLGSSADTSAEPSPEHSAESSADPRRWGKPILTTVALMALAGGLTAGSVAHVSAGGQPQPGTGHLVRAGHPAPVNAPQVVGHIQQFGNPRP